MKNQLLINAILALALVGCISSERKAEYEAWRTSDDGQPSVSLEEFELKHKDGWRTRAEDKKKVRVAREAKEKAESERQAEYSAWCKSDDAVKDTDIVTFEKKYKDGWRNRATEKLNARLAKEKAELDEQNRRAKMKAESDKLRAERKTKLENEAQLLLSEIRVAHAKNNKYRSPYRKDSTKDSLLTITLPRIEVSEADRLAGEALLTNFGEKYLPNAFGAYEKAKESASEIQQVFNEEFAEPCKIKEKDANWESYNKVLERLVRVRTELFAYHDEICHYWMMWRFGVVNAADLAEIDSKPIGVQLLPENVKNIKYVPLKPRELDSKCADFVAKYAPESYAAYQTIQNERKELFHYHPIEKPFFYVDSAEHYTIICDDLSTAKSAVLLSATRPRALVVKTCKSELTCSLAFVYNLWLYYKPLKGHAWTKRKSE